MTMRLALCMLRLSLLHSLLLLSPACIPGTNSLPAGTGYILSTAGWNASATCSQLPTGATYSVAVRASSLRAQSTVSKLYQRRTCGSTTAEFWPVLTAIVHVNDGNVEYVTWDEGCAFCTSDDRNVCVPASLRASDFAQADGEQYNGCVTQCAGAGCSECADGKCDLKVCGKRASHAATEAHVVPTAHMRCALRLARLAGVLCVDWH